MENLNILRLYFTAAQMRSTNEWWRKLAPQSLGEHLLRQAKKSGIEQALLHRIIGGYMNGHQLAMDTGEVSPARLPQCLELVGSEEILKAFLQTNQNDLKNVRSVFLRGEEARIEAALEAEQLREGLKLEKAT